MKTLVLRVTTGCKDTTAPSKVFTAKDNRPWTLNQPILLLTTSPNLIQTNSFREMRGRADQA